MTPDVPGSRGIARDDTVALVVTPVLYRANGCCPSAERLRRIASRLTREEAPSHVAIRRGTRGRRHRRFRGRLLEAIGIPERHGTLGLPDAAHSGIFQRRHCPWSLGASLGRIRCGPLPAVRSAPARLALSLAWRASRRRFHRHPGHRRRNDSRLWRVMASAARPIRPARHRARGGGSALDRFRRSIPEE